MATVQEQLMLKRLPLDKWSARELLCLSSSVLRSGNQNWVSVSRAVRVFGEPNRPEDWFSQKNCAVQYSTMLEKAETPKRKKRTSSSEKDAPVETVGEMIVRKYTTERIDELKRILEEDRADYLKLQREVEILQSGNATEEQIAIWTQEEENKRKQKEVDAQNRALWLQERERRRAQLERAWKPMPTTARRKIPIGNIADTLNQSDTDASVDSTLTALFNTDVLGEDSPETKTVPSTPTSPFLTSLLKNPPPTKMSPSTSILHSAITSQRGSTPTITSLLSSSPGVPQPHVKSYSQPSQEETVPTLSMLLKLPPGTSDSDVKHGATGSQYTSLPADSVHLSHQHQPYNLPKNDTTNENDLANTMVDDMEPIEIGLEEIIADLEQGGGSDSNKELPEEVVTPSSVDTFHKIFDDFYAMNVKKQDSAEPVPKLPDYNDIHAIYEQAAPEKSLEASIEESLPDIKITESEVKQLQGGKVLDLFSDDLLVVQEILDRENVILTQASKQDAKPVVKQTDSTEIHNEVLPSTPMVIPASEANISVSVGLVEEPEVKDSVGACIRTVGKGDVDKVFTKETTVNSLLLASDIKECSQTLKSPDQPADLKNSETESLQPNASGLKQLSQYSDADDEEDDEDLAEESSTQVQRITDDEQEKPSVSKNNDSSILKSELLRQTETDDASNDLESSTKNAHESKSTALTKNKDVDENKQEAAAIVEKVSESAEDSRDKSVMSEDRVCEDSSEATEVSSEYSNQEKLAIVEVSTPKSETSSFDLISSARRLLRRAGTPAMDSLPSSPASVTTDEEKEHRAWKKAIMLVWNSVAAHKYASVFLKPITDEQAPHYSDTCYGPVDMGLIKRNIETGVIRTTSEFHRDVLRMFTNAVMYNTVDHDIHKIALEIRLDSQQQITDFIKTQQLIQSPGDRATMRRETRLTDASSSIKRKRDSDVSKVAKKRKVLSLNP